MDWIKALGPYVPLFQTLLWVVALATGAFLFRVQISELVGAVRRRVQSGSSLRAGPLEIGEDFQGLKYFRGGAGDTEKLLDPGRSSRIPVDDRESHRVGIYEKHRGVFLAHLIEPSAHSGQVYDIFIFLIRHKSRDFDDVAKAEFFFGHMWGNQIFDADMEGELIGVSTSAWGPFLCTCRVTFTDGEVLNLYRYIDFEMGRVFKEPRPGDSNDR